MAIGMAIALLATSAFALFSSTATVSGVTFSTGNADLQVWDGSTWVADWTSPTFNFSNMFPGYGGTGASEGTSTSYQTMYLKNLSTSAIALNIVGTLRNGLTETPAGSWDALKDQVMVAVLLSDWSGGTGWHTLNEWYTTGYTLPGGSLAQNTQREYRFYVRVNGAAGNEIATKGLTLVNFDFLGTQE